MSGIDLVIDFYRLLNVPSITDLLDGGRVWRYNRPLNSDFTDVVISMPEYIGGSFNTANIEINIHTPNIKNFEPLGFEDVTHPNVLKLQEVTDAVLDVLGDVYNLKTSGKVVRDKDGHWYSNIIVEVKDINEADSVDVELIEYISVDDGFGGVIPSSSVVWSGKGAFISFANNVNDLDESLGRYEMNRHAEIAIPSIVDVKKNMSLIISDDEYIIKGIRPVIGFPYTSIKAVKDD